MQLLQFIALIVQATIPVKRLFYHKSISAFFKHVIDWLAYPLHSTDAREKMLQCLLTTLAMLEISGDWDHITKLWGHEDIWYLVMDREHVDILIDGTKPLLVSWLYSYTYIRSCVRSVHYCH